MTIIGLDDTDSREHGMCTTYIADTVARTLAEHGATIDRLLIVRCNPAVEYKTRGNAALAIHTDADPSVARSMAVRTIAETAVVQDDRTNPGLVVAPGDPDDISDAIRTFAVDAVRDHHTRDTAQELIKRADYWSKSWDSGRGVIGALAAVGAWSALDDWTYEMIAYRERDRWGTERTVNPESVFEVAESYYPAIWDTVDRGSNTVVCAPRTPGPVLYGIRGDDPEACRAAVDRIQSEPIAHSRLFVTNQGTDGHLQSGTVAEVRDGRAYQVDGTVNTSPETRRGGHVFFEFTDDSATLSCVAFEPTKRFRDRVRSLRVGDTITVCGEITDGTLKLEKFAVEDLVRTEAVPPQCTRCGRTMKSAGRTQGYRCRSCGTTSAGKVHRTIHRELEPGWYEVPPRARRHIAKPLVRGGFDGPTNPEV